MQNMNFSFGNFKEDLSEIFLDCKNSYDEFESAYNNNIRQTCNKKEKLA